MPKRPESNFIQIQELKTLIDQSQLPVHSFAFLMGTPYGTLRAKLNGQNRATLLDLNAAKFVMLRMGHRVDAPPVPVDSLPKRRRYHRNQLGRVAARNRASKTGASGNL